MCAADPIAPQPLLNPHAFGSGLNSMWTGTNGSPVAIRSVLAMGHVPVCWLGC